MILSDVDIRKEVAAGRIVIDPFEDACVQPSSVDLHVDAQFRVFANSRYPYIDVESRDARPHRARRGDGDEPFILHPGEFVLGSTLERVALPDDLVARLEGKSSLGRLGPADPFDGRLRRPGLGRLPHARAVERREPADHDLPGDEDRADLVLPAHDARPSPVRIEGDAEQVPGSARARRRAGSSRSSAVGTDDDPDAGLSRL